MSIECTLCVQGQCLIIPKVFTTAEDRQDHIQNKCRVITLKDVFTIPNRASFQSTVDDLMAKDLEKLRVDTNEKINLVNVAFQQFLIQLRQVVLKTISDEFSEVKRLQRIFLAVKHKEKEFFVGLNGDLSFLVEETRIEDVIRKSDTQKNDLTSKLDKLISKMKEILSLNQKTYFREREEREEALRNSSRLQAYLKMERDIKKYISPEWLPIEQQFVQDKQILHKKDFTIVATKGRNLCIKATEGLIMTYEIIMQMMVISKILLPFQLTIDLSYTKLINVRAFTELRTSVNLTSLTIIFWQCQVFDIKPLSDLKTLTNLLFLRIDLNSNQVTDIRPLIVLKSLVKLQTLNIDLWKNQVSDLAPFIEFKEPLLNLSSIHIDFRENELPKETNILYDTIVALSKLE